jgi:magnesium-protoporphyrin IX monomethyl ester (oxidative) cyclase
VRDHTRPMLHVAMGLDPDSYDYQVFDITTEISKQVFPISLDTNHERFRAGLRRLLEASDGIARAKAQGGVAGLAKQAGWALVGMATFARLYLHPVHRHDLPAQMRVAPAW